MERVKRRAGLYASLFAGARERPSTSLHYTEHWSTLYILLFFSYVVNSILAMDTHSDSKRLQMRVDPRRDGQAELTSELTKLNTELVLYWYCSGWTRIRTASSCECRTNCRSRGSGWWDIDCCSRAFCDTRSRRVM